MHKAKYILTRTIFSHPGKRDYAPLMLEKNIIFLEEYYVM